jgi:hypothetical protein
MSSGAKKIKKGERISIEFLPPIYPGEMKPEELNERVKQRIEAAIRP